jgi:hypothetical protein
MMLMLHIFIALGSLAYTTYLCAVPSPRKFRVSYILVALTLLSGTYLAALNPSHIAEACAVGLVYTAVALAGTILARRKFAAQNI